jgi:hypothetical protein
VTIQTEAEQLVQLRAYVKSVDSELGYVTGCARSARALVLGYIGAATVPADTIDRAILEVGASLYDRLAARTGSADYDGVGMATLQTPKDPLRMAYPLLSAYVPGFA